MNENSKMCFSRNDSNEKSNVKMTYWLQPKFQYSADLSSNKKVLKFACPATLGRRVQFYANTVENLIHKRQRQ